MTPLTKKKMNTSQILPHSKGAVGWNYFSGQITELKQNVNRQCTYSLTEYESIFMANLAIFVFSIFKTKSFTQNQTIIDVELILVFNSSVLLAVNSIFVSSV